MAFWNKNSATNISDSVNSSLSSTLISNSASCAQNNSVDQFMSFSDIKTKGGCKLDFSNIDQTANIAPNLSCSQKSENTADLKNKFSNALDQEVTAKLSGIPSSAISDNTTTNISSIKNVIVNSVNISEISTCIQNNLAKQKLEFSKIEADCTGCGWQTDKLGNSVNTCIQTFDNISQTLIMNGVTKCTQDNSTLVKATNELENVIKQVATSSNTGLLGGLLDLFSGQSGIVIAILVGLMFLLVVLFKFF